MQQWQLWWSIWTWTSRFGDNERKSWTHEMLVFESIKKRLRQCTTSRGSTEIIWMRTLPQQQLNSSRRRHMCAWFIEVFVIFLLLIIITEIYLISLRHKRTYLLRLYSCKKNVCFIMSFSQLPHLSWQKSLRCQLQLSLDSFILSLRRAKCAQKAKFVWRAGFQHFPRNWWKIWTSCESYSGSDKNERVFMKFHIYEIA